MELFERQFPWMLVTLAAHGSAGRSAVHRIGPVPTTVHSERLDWLRFERPIAAGKGVAEPEVIPWPDRKVGHVYRKNTSDLWKPS